MLFYDADTLAPAAKAQFALSRGSTTICLLGIECHTNYKLSCNPIPNIEVNARLLGDSVWISIEVIPIDLTPYNGFIKIFEFQFIVGNITQNERIISGLKISI